MVFCHVNGLLIKCSRNFLLILLDVGQCFFPWETQLLSLPTVRWFLLHLSFRVHPKRHVSFHWDGAIVTCVSFSFSLEGHTDVACLLIQFLIWDFVRPVSNQNIFYKMLWLHEKVLKILRARRDHSAALLADQPYFREQLVLITNTVSWFIGSWTKSLLCVCVCCVSLASFPRPLHHSPPQVKIFFCHHCRFAVSVRNVFAGVRRPYDGLMLAFFCWVHYLHSSDS